MLKEALFKELDMVWKAFLRSERMRKDGKHNNTKRNFPFSPLEEEVLMKFNNTNPLMSHILKALDIRKAVIPIYSRRSSNRNTQSMWGISPDYPIWKRDLRHWVYPSNKPFDESDYICNGYPPICMAAVIAMEAGATEPFYTYIKERYANKTGHRGDAVDERSD